MSNLVLDACESYVVDPPCDIIDLLIQPRGTHRTGKVGWN
jgi:hypothetical protein